MKISIIAETLPKIKCSPAVQELYVAANETHPGMHSVWVWAMTEAIRLHRESERCQAGGDK